MPYNFSVNERFSVQTVPVGNERQPVLVVDDFLSDPDSMVRYAVDQVHMQPAPSYYPGVGAETPQGYVAALYNGLAAPIAETFGVHPPSGKLTSSFYAIVTLPPEQLQPLQRMPHIDTHDPGQIAILHYLCDRSQGGTAFYRHRATGYESLDREQNAHMRALLDEDIARNGPLPAQYINASSRLFEQTACFEARFNRLLIYRSRILHSAMIDANTRLDPDPRVGRLTTNTFVRFAL